MHARDIARQTHELTDVGVYWTCAPQRSLAISERPPRGDVTSCRAPPLESHGRLSPQRPLPCTTGTWSLPQGSAHFPEHGSQIRALATETFLLTRDHTRGHHRAFCNRSSIHKWTSFLCLTCVFLPRYSKLKYCVTEESACQCRRREFDPWVGKIPWRRKWQGTPVFLPGESHGQRSLVGYSPRGHKELDTIKQLNNNSNNP